MQISGYTNRVFSPEMRAYFDVDTTTVKNKLLKLLMPFKTFEFEYLLCDEVTRSRSWTSTFRLSAS